ncbi:PREDICTED: uncharacterized protein LOC107531059 isoform X2 [Miniopterus natalensis]|uniref:uncharacterized protein LOC107531059 isoform X2 n=1 Tax=Miniopterus natalensis TaxID=291302 RepID=UPI0007A6B8BB|nr:PREDICTED: uncharacterized protein LOC107531059 isoform X2 [Miniopterus natalensis]
MPVNNTTSFVSGKEGTRITGEGGSNFLGGLTVRQRLLHFSPGEIPCTGASPSALQPRRNPLQGSPAFCTSAQAKSPAGEPRLLHFSPGEIPCTGASPSAFQPRRNHLHGSLAFCISAQAKSPAREPRQRARRITLKDSTDALVRIWNEQAVAERYVKHSSSPDFTQPPSFETDVRGEETDSHT